MIVGNYLFGNPEIATVGSSGAIYGILLASAVMWPDRQMLFYFLIPLKMKYFVMIIGAIAFLNSFQPGQSGQRCRASGGCSLAMCFSNFRACAVSDPVGSLHESYRVWKLARAKKKFQVYMRKQGSGRDRRIH